MDSTAAPAAARWAPLKYTATATEKLMMDNEAFECDLCGEIYRMPARVHFMCPVNRVQGRICGPCMAAITRQTAADAEARSRGENIPRVVAWPEEWGVGDARQEEEAEAKGPLVISA